jgi:hypothetical protein
VWDSIKPNQPYEKDNSQKYDKTNEGRYAAYLFWKCK